MATIIFSNVGNFKVTIISNFAGTKHKVLETGFESDNEKIAIRNARKYLHKLSGIKDRKRKKEPKVEPVIGWEYEKTTSFKFENEELLSIAEEIKKFKKERNDQEKQRSIRVDNNRKRSKRNVSGVRLDPNFREVYRRENLS